MKESIVSSLNIGIKSNKLDININLNKKNLNISKYLFNTGFLSSYFLNKKNNKITLTFSSFYDKKPILYVKKISNPGRKIYITYIQLKKKLLYKNNILVLSTSKGILNNKEAILNKIGGELLFIIKC